MFGTATGLKTCQQRNIPVGLKYFIVFWTTVMFLSPTHIFVFLIPKPSCRFHCFVHQMLEVTLSAWADFLTLLVVYVCICVFVRVV